MSLASFSGLGHYGELGNQMFQIATVYGYARKYGKDPVFPEWTCKISGRNYTDIFKNPIDQTLHSRIVSHADFRRFNYMDLTYVEIPDTPYNLDFIGYFQSEKYFLNCEDEIRKIFQPKDEIVESIQNKYSEVLSIKNRVSLQVRTGGRNTNDYDVHAYANKDFIEKCQSHFPDAELFVVFADNMELAKQMLPDGKNYFFVENEENYIDLFFMNMFDSYIVSPSTFGWWGAWLSQNKEAKVVIMKDWFAIGKSKEYLNINNDQVPERWIKI
jgi:hypothetical protein